MLYNAYKKALLDGEIDHEGDTIKVALLTSSYTPNQDDHATFDDLTNEVTGTGYTAGGEELANKSVSQDNTNDRALFDADDVTWESSTITARYAVVYKDTGTASTSPLIALFDFGEDESSDGTSLTIEWNAAGILAIN